MNLFQYGIASIVDANTGYGFVADYRSTHTASAERRGRAIRSRSVIALSRKLGEFLARLYARLRDHSEQRSALHELNALSDRGLADIGLERYDLFRVESGAASLDQVVTTRREELVRERTGRLDASATETTVSSATGIVETVSKWIERYRKQAQERRYLRQLLAMDDHLLRDIGLGRGDLIAVELGQLSLHDLDQIRFQRRNKVRLFRSKGRNTVADKQAATGADEAVSQVAGKCA